MEWMNYAICREVDPGLFVPDGDSNDVTAKVKQAKAICANCPVDGECRDYAFSLAREGTIHGVWGGLTAAEINRQARHPARKKAA